MEILVKRIAFKDTYTIGKLHINGKYFCDTLEDKNRDLDKSGRFEGEEKKLYGKTCIPFGEYKIKLCHSPKFTPRYGRLMPWIQNVPNFSGILIHPGNTSADTLGCILVGKNKLVGQLLETRKTWTELMDNHIIPANNRGESITIKIV